MKRNPEVEKFTITKKLSLGLAFVADIAALGFAGNGLFHGGKAGLESLAHGASDAYRSEMLIGCENVGIAIVLGAVTFGLMYIAGFRFSESEDTKS